MPSSWSIVLEIAAVGSAQLFGYLAGLVGLMYVLTSPGLYARFDPTPASPASDPTADASGDAADEAERRRRAVALAVAVACGSGSRPAPPAGGPSPWQRLHRGRRLSQPAYRQRARS